MKNGLTFTDSWSWLIFKQDQLVGKNIPVTWILWDMMFSKIFEDF